MNKFAVKGVLNLFQSKGFLMFSGDIEREKWPEMNYFLLVCPVRMICTRLYHAFFVGSDNRLAFFFRQEKKNIVN